MEKKSSCSKKMPEKKIAAIYTTFYPDKDFFMRIAEVIKNCSHTIIVDNTPGGFPFILSDTKNITLLQDGNNKGLGVALNLGIDEAIKLKCDTVVFFDQDSSPTSNFITELLDALSLAGAKSIVGPTLIDDKNYSKLDIRSPISSSIKLSSVKSIPTSGMCFHLNKIYYNERFTDNFFLDFVDFDWCWRMLAKDWKIYRINSLYMPHRLGIEQRKILGFRFHVPAPFRHYFQFRDTLKLAVMQHVPIYSRIRLLSILIPKFCIYPFLLDRGFERVRWMTIGIIDAFKNTKGVGAASVKLQKKYPKN